MGPITLQNVLEIVEHQQTLLRTGDRALARHLAPHTIRTLAGAISVFGGSAEQRAQVDKQVADLMHEHGLTAADLELYTFVIEIEGKGVVAFRAEDQNMAQLIVDQAVEGDEDSSMIGVIEDLHCLESRDGKPLWNGSTELRVRPATPAEHEKWEKARNADLDNDLAFAGDDSPNDWICFLIPVVDPADDAFLDDDDEDIDNA